MQVIEPWCNLQPREQLLFDSGLDDPSFSLNEIRAVIFKVENRRNQERGYFRKKVLEPVEQYVLRMDTEVRRDKE